MSEHKLPELTKPLSQSKHWDAGIDRPLAGERAARLEREDQLRDAFERIARVEAERDAMKEQMRYHEINLDERTQLCESEGIPPSDCCAPKYCALAPYKEVTRLRAALARMQGPVTDEEWAEATGYGTKSKFMTHAEIVNALLAARAGREGNDGNN